MHLFFVLQCINEKGVVDLISALHYKKQSPYPFPDPMTNAIKNQPELLFLGAIIVALYLMRPDYKLEYQQRHLQSFHTLSLPSPNLTELVLDAWSLR